MKNLKSALKNLISAIFNHGLYQDSRNIERALQYKALQETAEFVEQFMPLVQSFDSRYTLMAHACNQIKNMNTPGLVCEFGVAAGKSINFIAQKLPERKIFGFDSFEGLPETWRDSHPAGQFKVKNMPRVAPNVTLIKGWFDETLPTFLNQHTDPIALLHIDCDLYSSTKTVFSLAKSRLQPGSIIVFDEFFNYPGWKNGEYRAFYEMIEETSKPFEYIGYSRYGTQVAVRLT